jgi:predicted porin
MIRGFMKTTSRPTLLVAAGILMGSYAFAPAAKAADLGGSGCCGDLEERVAELEATTARKGNRKVSLQIYGQVNRGLLVWDDGSDADAYVVDNDAQSTRFGFTGKATMKPGWTTGFSIELEVQDAASDEVDQLTDDAGGTTEIIRTRLANWYIESERLGRLTLGQASTASDGITEITLHNNAGKNIGSTALAKSFVVLGRDAAGALPAGAVRWGDISSNLSGLSRNDIVRYDTPSIHGFIVSASWGDSDLWDVALRFKKEWNSFRIAAGVGYWVDAQGAPADEKEGIGGSISVMHIPTGLFGTFSIAEQDHVNTIAEEDASYWALQLGIERKWLPYGATTIYGEYASYEGDFDGAASVFCAGGSCGTFVGVEASKWGISVVQNFDQAALDIYAHAEFWDSDGVVPVGTQPAGDGELSLVLIGSRIKF